MQQNPPLPFPYPLMEQRKQRGQRVRMDGERPATPTGSARTVPQRSTKETKKGGGGMMRKVITRRPKHATIVLYQKKKQGADFWFKTSFRRILC